MLCLFGTLSHRVGPLQISIIIVVRDREPRMTTLIFTQLLNSVIHFNGGSFIPKGGHRPCKCIPICFLSFLFKFIKIYNFLFLIGSREVIQICYRSNSFLLSFLLFLFFYVLLEFTIFHLWWPKGVYPNSLWNLFSFFSFFFFIYIIFIFIKISNFPFLVTQGS